MTFSLLFLSFFSPFFFLSQYRRKKDGHFQEGNEGENAIYTGLYAINIHRANAQITSAKVNKWSAGCQVFASPDDFAEVLSAVTAELEKKDSSSEVSGAACQTYTLLEKNDIPASSNWKGVPYTQPPVANIESPFDGWMDPNAWHSEDESEQQGWSVMGPQNNVGEETQ